MDARSREIIRILLVDGSRDDVALVREHVRGQRAQLELVHMADGDAARAYLGQRGAYADSSWWSCRRRVWVGPSSWDG